VTGDHFELFWSAYPRRVAKKDAKAAFTKAMKKTTMDAILSALEWQREQEGWQQRDPDGVLRHVPHPASWLNGERWDDERPQKKNTAAIVPFMTPTCGSCVDGWREDDLHRVYRCDCRTVKARSA
jgi:hypothetical protein